MSDLNIKCCNCGSNSYGPILQNNLWEMITKSLPLKSKSLLCLLCIEKRMVRQLKLEDLKPCAINDNLITVMKRQQFTREALENLRNAVAREIFCNGAGFSAAYVEAETKARAALAGEK